MKDLFTTLKYLLNELYQETEQDNHKYWYDEILKTVKEIENLNKKYKNDYDEIEIDYIELKERFQEDYIDIDEKLSYFSGNYFEL